MTTGNLDPLWDRFRPPEPGARLVTWLAGITPPDAPVLPLYCGSVPLVAPPPEGMLNALRAALGKRGQRPEALAAVMARPPVRDGLPRAYPRFDTPPEDLVRREGEARSRAALPYWRVEAAYLRDLEGASSKDLGKGLDLSDAKPPIAFEMGGKRVQYKQPIEPDRSRNAERDYVRPGRVLLATLGAWPWSLAREADGRLPRRWWTLPEYASTLAAWHRAAFLDAHGRNEASAAYLGDAHLEPSFLHARALNGVALHTKLCSTDATPPIKERAATVRGQLAERARAGDPDLALRRPPPPNGQKA